MDRRQFLNAVVVSGVVALGAPFVGSSAIAAATSGLSPAGTTEQWLLGTGRHALGG